MRKRLPHTCAALLALFAALAGCGDGGIKRQPNAAVIAVDVAPNYGSVYFQREQRLEATLEYHGGSKFAFEADQYDFNVGVQPIGATQVQPVASFTQTLRPENAYYFVLAQSASGKVIPITVTRPKFDAASSDAEVNFVNAASTLANADVFLTAPGDDLLAANPIGSASFGADLGPLTFAPGDYVLSLTEPGNPANVLFTSPTQTLAAGEANLFVVGPGSGTSTLSMTRAGNVITGFVDANAPAALRAIVVAPDKAARDVIIDNQTATPLFAALPYATVTDYADVTPGGRSIMVTPAGNPGVIEVDETSSLAFGRRHTFFAAGSDTGLASYAYSEDGRSIKDEAHLRILNGANQFDSLTYFVLTPPSDLSASIPVAILNVLGVTPSIPLPPGDYEITMEAPDHTIVFGPTLLTLAGGGNYSVLTIDGADATSADVVYFDDFN